MSVGPRLPDAPRVSVLICALNEEESIPHVLPKIPAWVDEVLVVDGGSTDQTVEVARKLRPGIRILHQARKGKGDAIKFGVRESGGDIIVTLDADGETDPHEIERFVDPLLRGFDFVKGSRLMHGRPAKMPFHRWVGNKVLTWTYNILHGTKYTDVCSGYSAFWKRAFLKLDLTLDSFEMEQEALVKAARLGLKVSEVFHYDMGRIGGVSKTKDIRQGFIDWWIIIRERFRR